MRFMWAVGSLGSETDWGNLVQRGRHSIVECKDWVESPGRKYFIAPTMVSGDVIENQTIAKNSLFLQALELSARICAICLVLTNGVSVVISKYWRGQCETIPAFGELRNEY